jgi:uncharacterized protein (DUF433 family)
MHRDTEAITRDPQILGGTPVFTGTRVPVQNLMDYLASGQNLDAFLEDFPAVSREDARRVLRLAQEALVASADSP